MRLINIDYNPLRRSEATRTRANQSAYFARDIALAKDRAELSRKYLDIHNESLGLSRRKLDLQKQEFITNAVLQGVNVTSNIVSAIYNTVNQRNLQKQKSIESDYEKELIEQVSEDVKNGTTRFDTGEDGTLEWTGLSDAAKSIQQKYQERIKSEIWNLPLSGSEQRANQSLDIFRNKTETTAIQACMIGAEAERNTIAANLLKSAVNLTIGSYDPETGGVDYSAIEGQIRSMNWLSPGEQGILLQQEIRKADLGINRNILSGTTKTEGYQKAIETLDDPTSMIGELTDEDKAQFKEYVAQVDKETFTRANADATQTFNRLSVSQRDESGNITQEALPLSEAVDQAMQTVTREQDRDTIKIQLFKQQDRIAVDRGYQAYTTVRDKSLTEIERTAQDYFEGGAQFDEFATGEARKEVQDLFQRRIDAKKDALGGQTRKASTEGEFDANAELEILAKTYRDKIPIGANGEPMTRDAFVNRTIELSTKGASASAVAKVLNEAIAGDRTGMKGPLERLTINYQTMMKAKGISGDAAKSGELTELYHNALDSLRDAIGNNAGTSEIDKSVDIVSGLMGVPQYDQQKLGEVLSNGLRDRLIGGRQSDYEIYKQAAQQGTLDDLIYNGPDGKYHYVVRGNDQVIKQAIEHEKHVLGDLGIQVKDSDLARQETGKGSRFKDDVGGDIIHTGQDGNKYRVRLENGKTYVEKQEGGAWQPQEVNKEMQEIQKLMRSISGDKARESYIDTYGYTKAYLDAGYAPNGQSIETVKTKLQTMNPGTDRITYMRSIMSKSGSASSDMMSMLESIVQTLTDEQKSKYLSDLNQVRRTYGGSK